jgi:hypothetical protein
MNTHPAKSSPLQQVTEAPPIMVAPNPTAKQILNVTKRMHTRTTRNNIPGSIPAITRSPSVQRPLPVPTPSPIEVTPRRLPRTNAQSSPQPGGVRNSNLISQDAIKFLTKRIWEKSPDIFRPKILMPTLTLTCLDYAQVAIQ